jgi:ATP-binding cassette subfamily C protein CydD
MEIGKRLIRYVPHLRLYMAILGGLAIIAGLAVVAQAYALTRVINGVFLERQSLEQVGAALLVLLGVIVVRALVAGGNELVSNRAAVVAKTQLRTRLFAHLLALGPAYSSEERSGELASTFVEGAETFDAYFGQFLPQVCATACIPLIVLAVVFATDPLSGLTLLVIAPVLPILLALVGKKADALNKAQWSQLSQLSAHFLDVMQGLVTLKQFGRSRVQRETIGRMSEQFRKVTMKVLRVAFLSSLVLELGAMLSVAVIAVEIGLRLMYGAVSFERAFLVLLLTPEFFQPLRALGTRFHASMAGSVAAERMFAILDQPASEQPSELVTAPASVPTLQQSLSVEHVSFAYTDQEGERRPALNDVTFQIERGQKLALVGPSGAGKSTIASLLLRFMEPQEGEIVADGMPIQTWTAQAWRELVAWVPQRPYLFNASIAENIRLGCPDATMDEAIQAARFARLHDFIQTLPQGYATMIGERGARLSGGQAQRVSLARAFIKNAPLLILDEATSNLDGENEEEILQAMERLMQGRMTLIIAHRLHTVAHADRIVLLDAGRVVEVGTHQELLARSSAYRRMMEAYQRKEAVV